MDFFVAFVYEKWPKHSYLYEMNHLMDKLNVMEVLYAAFNNFFSGFIRFVIVKINILMTRRRQRNNAYF